MFDIKGFNNPPTTEKIYYEVTTYHLDSKVYDIDSSDSKFYVEAATGTISIASFTPNQTEIYYSDGEYQVTMTAEHDIVAGYQLKFTFPSAFGVVQNSGCIVTGLGSSYTCSADGTNKIITVANAVDSTVVGGTAITFVITAVQNPGIFTSPG